MYGKTQGHHCWWLTHNGQSLAHFDDESQVDAIVAQMNKGLHDADNPSGEGLYQVSRDYPRLFELLCQGHEVAGYVDHRMRGDDQVCRDICRLRRFKEFDISFSVRGTMYGGVYSFDRDKYADEKEAFTAACQETNLAWLLPHQEVP